jgi:hypothetical protein
LKELEQGMALDIHRARRRGGGRKKATEKDTTLLSDLENTGGASNARRPDVALALDLQEHNEAGR